MTINHVYKTVEKIMKKLESIDFISLDQRKFNQAKVNEAYKVLDNFKDELIRENIKGKEGTKENDIHKRRY